MTFARDNGCFQSRIAANQMFKYTYEGTFDRCVSGLASRFARLSGGGTGLRDHLRAETLFLRQNLSHLAKGLSPAQILRRWLAAE